MTRSLCSLVFITAALAACSPDPAAPESADDFAARIGGEGGSAGTPANPQARAEQPNVAGASAPAGADVTSLQQLGDIAKVDLGPRDGGCTFMVGEQEMLLASGVRDRAMGGKGVIRVGGGLVRLDSGPGGFDAIRRGVDLKGEGVTVAVRPAAGAAPSRPANVTVTSADGKSQAYSGTWVCA